MHSTLRHAFGLALFMRDAVSPPGFQSRRTDGARMWTLAAHSRMGKGAASERERMRKKEAERERQVDGGRPRGGGAGGPTSSYRWLWIRQKRVECLTRTIHRRRVTVANDRQPFSFIPGDTSKLGVVRRRLPSREAAISAAAKRRYLDFILECPRAGPTHGFSRAAITASCKTAIRAQLYGLVTAELRKLYTSSLYYSTKGYASAAF